MKLLVPFYGYTLQMIKELRNSFADLENLKISEEQDRDSLKDGTLPPAAQRAQKARKFVKNAGAPGLEKKS